MSIKYTCNECDHVNSIPTAEARRSSKCKRCGEPLAHARKTTGERSAMIGLIGGMALGTAGGPWGVVIGGVLGVIFGMYTKGAG